VPTASKQSINGRHGMTVTLLTVNMYMFPSHHGDCNPHCLHSLKLSRYLATWPHFEASHLSFTRMRTGSFPHSLYSKRSTWYPLFKIHEIWQWKFNQEYIPDTDVADMQHGHTGQGPSVVFVLHIH